MDNREKGARAEKVAVKYLKDIGYEIIEQNYSNKVGEIDIIAKDVETIVFIEVKYRETLSKGRPYEAVSPYKQKKIIKVAYLYAQYHDLFECSMRFDVVEIVGKYIRVIKNAFVVEGNSKYL